MMATDLTTQIAIYRRTLAEATKGCPEDWGRNFVPYVKDCPHPVSCICKGTGCIARFPEFRQVCNHSPRGYRACDGMTWHARAGGLEDAEAGLTVEEFCKVETERFGWAASMKWHDPMPDRDTILLKGLELIAKAAGL